MKEEQQAVMTMPGDQPVVEPTISSVDIEQEVPITSGTPSVSSEMSVIPDAIEALEDARSSRVAEMSVDLDLDGSISPEQAEALRAIGIADPSQHRGCQMLADYNPALIADLLTVADKTKSTSQTVEGQRELLSDLVELLSNHPEDLIDTSQGKTTIEHLANLTKDVSLDGIAPGTPEYLMRVNLNNPVIRTSAVASTVQEILEAAKSTNIEGINQGLSATCGVTSLILNRTRSNPAWYANFCSQMGGESGAMRMEDGSIYTRNVAAASMNYVPYSHGGRIRSFSENWTQSSAMQGSERDNVTYNPVEDEMTSSAAGRTYRGLHDYEIVSRANAILGAGHNMYENSPETRAAIQDLTDRSNPVEVSVWYEDTGKDQAHIMTVTRIANGVVTFENPHGKEETWPLERFEKNLRGAVISDAEIRELSADQQTALREFAMINEDVTGYRNDRTLAESTRRRPGEVANPDETANPGEVVNRNENDSAPADETPEQTAARLAAAGAAAGAAGDLQDKADQEGFIAAFEETFKHWKGKAKEDIGLTGDSSENDAYANIYAGVMTLSIMGMQAIPIVLGKANEWLTSGMNFFGGAVERVKNLFGFGGDEEPERGSDQSGTQNDAAPQLSDLPGYEHEQSDGEDGITVAERAHHLRNIARHQSNPLDDESLG